MNSIAHLGTWRVNDYNSNLVLYIILMQRWGGRMGRWVAIMGFGFIGQSLNEMVQTHHVCTI